MSRHEGSCSSNESTVAVPLSEAVPQSGPGSGPLSTVQTPAAEHTEVTLPHVPYLLQLSLGSDGLHRIALSEKTHKFYMSLT